MVISDIDSVAGTDNTERSATVRAVLEDFYNSLDDRNKIIFNGMVNSETERAIAPSVGITSTAVHNRMVKIRAELATLI